ncbi:MAG: hypothetical protein ABS35_35630 [Kaistia sp. SCN 65-12]|nr:MAG: hypothetical protein ABS35_35630 [Kaistia sp. SCN 65-12]
MNSPAAPAQRLYPWQDRKGAFSPLKTVVFVGVFLPGLWLIARAAMGTLGPRQMIEINHQAGLWAIRFLLLTLAVTPLRHVWRWPELVFVRRTLGNAAFTYVLIHLVAYAGDLAWDIPKVVSEIFARVYLTIGKNPEAIKLLRDSFARNPHHIDTKTLLQQMDPSAVPVDRTLTVQTGPVEEHNPWLDSSEREPEVVIFEGHMRQGRALLAEGQEADALKSFRAALSLRPKDRDCLVETGRLYARRGMLGLGADLLQQGYALNPQDFSLLPELMSCLVRADDMERDETMAALVLGLPANLNRAGFVEALAALRGEESMDQLTDTVVQGLLSRFPSDAELRAHWEALRTPAVAAEEPVVEAGPDGFEAATDSESAEVVEPGPDGFEEPVSAAEPEPEPAVEPEVVVESEPAATAEPEPVAVEPELEPEPVVQPEPEVTVEPAFVAEPEVVVVPEAVVAAEPEAPIEPEPEPEPEPEVSVETPVVPEPVIEPEPEPEPVVEPMVEPEPVVAIEPEPVVEPAMEPEPEPGPELETEIVAAEPEFSEPAPWVEGELVEVGTQQELWRVQPRFEGSETPAELLRQLARKLAVQGHYREAVLTLSRALEWEPTVGAAWLEQLLGQWCDQLEQTEQLEAALQVCQSWCELFPDQPEAARRLKQLTPLPPPPVEEEIPVDDLGQALEAMRAHASNEGLVARTLQLGEGRDEELLNVFRVLIRDHSDEPLHFRNFARCYLKQNKPILAVVQYQKYLVARPTAAGYRELAEAYTLLKREKNAAEALKKAEELAGR